MIYPGPNRYYYHKAMGLALGYPPCCIESFASGDRWAFHLTDQEREVLRRQSVTFVPCVHHTYEMMQGLNLSDLVGGRSNLPNSQLMLIKSKVVGPSRKSLPSTDS